MGNTVQQFLYIRFWATQNKTYRHCFHSQSRGESARQVGRRTNTRDGSKQETIWSSKGVTVLLFCSTCTVWRPLASVSQWLMLGNVLITDWGNPHTERVSIVHHAWSASAIGEEKVCVSETWPHWGMSLELGHGRWKCLGMGGFNKRTTLLLPSDSNPQILSPLFFQAPIHI